MFQTTNQMIKARAGKNNTCLELKSPNRYITIKSPALLVSVPPLPDKNILHVPLLQPVYISLPRDRLHYSNWLHHLVVSGAFTQNASHNNF